MTKNKKSFSHLKEKYMQFPVELGGDGMYAARGVGIVSFQRELGNPLHLRCPLCSRLKQNLFLVATLEDKGYDVIFSKVKAYLQHLAFGCKKQIGVKKKNLYKFQVETDAALSNKVGRAQSKEVMVEESRT